MSSLLLYGVAIGGGKATPKRISGQKDFQEFQNVPQEYDEGRCQ